MPLIKVIIGSTRPGRFGIQPANWLMELAKEHPEATFELIDLAEVNLPFLDESQPPSVGPYTQEHSTKWAGAIGEADGFVIITAEYNHAAPPALLNAIDFVAKEWHYKPIAFVSYGASGGGIRAVEQLHNMFVWLRAYNMHDELSFRNYWAQLDEGGKLVPTEDQTAAAHRLLKNVAFWADRLKPIREALSKEK